MIADTDSADWQDVPDDTTLTAGTYRVVGTFRGPYTAATRDAMEITLRAKIELQGNTWASWNTMPPLWDEVNNVQGPWVYEAQFTRSSQQAPATAGVDGRVILLVLAAAAVLVGLAVVTQSVQKLVVAAGPAFQQATSTIFSPGTIILVVLAIFLITTRGHARAT